MIAVKLQGRLGNQLFQYAFAYATAKKLKTRFYLDPREQVNLLGNYFIGTKDAFFFLERNIFTIKGYKNLFSHHLRHQLYEGLIRLFKLKEIEISQTVNPTHELKKITDCAFYNGYYQSEKYFADYKQQILEHFKIKKKHKKLFNDHVIRIGIPKNYVLVHIRRTDYLHWGFELPPTYFHKAIESILDEKNFYVFITDDYDFVEKEFEYLTNRYISKETEIIDFQFLTNAYTCIISNSTFSWWGAYLNDKNPKVICPKYWIGQTDKIEFPAGIISEQWIQIDPNERH